MFKIIHFLIKSELIEIQTWLSTLSPLEKLTLHDWKVSKVIKVTKGHLTKNHFFLCIFCKNYIDDPHFLFGSIIRTPKSYSRTSAGSKTLFRLKIELKLDVWWQKALPNFLLKQQCYHIFKTSYPKQITSDTKVCLPILISMTDNVHNRKLVGLG